MIEVVGAECWVENCLVADLVGFFFVASSGQSYYLVVDVDSMFVFVDFVLSVECVVSLDPSCSNGVLDFGEVDIDCGGTICVRCFYGK